MMELFPNIVNGFQQLIIFAKSSIIDVWQGLKYTFELSMLRDGYRSLNLWVEIYLEIYVNENGMINIFYQFL